MKRLIKFDLPIDGVKVATLDDLRDHFTADILKHFRSGLLRKWLQARGLEEKVVKVDRLEQRRTTDDVSTLTELCIIFDIEPDEDAIAAAVERETGLGSVRLDDHASSREFWHWLRRLQTMMEVDHADFPDGLREFPVSILWGPKRGIFESPRPDFHLDERQLERSLTKAEWHQYLSTRIAMCLVMVRFLRVSPSQFHFGKLVKFAREDIADYISCYDLSPIEYEATVNRLMESPQSETLAAIMYSKALNESRRRVRKADLVKSIVKLEVL